MIRRATYLLGLGLLLIASVGVLAQSSDDFVPVSDAMLQEPDPTDWLMWRRTLDSWGYSPLDQINRETVGSLRMVWSRALAPGLQQGTPLVYDGVMYMPNPRDVIQAIEGATGDLVWEYRRSLPEDVDEFLIAVLAEIAGARLMLNELADTRADLLSSLFPAIPVTRFDAAFPRIVHSWGVDVVWI